MRNPDVSAPSGEPRIIDRLFVWADSLKERHRYQEGLAEQIAVIEGLLKEIGDHEIEAEILSVLSYWYNVLTEFPGTFADGDAATEQISAFQERLQICAKILARRVDHSVTSQEIVSSIQKIPPRPPKIAEEKREAARYGGKGLEPLGIAIDEFSWDELWSHRNPDESLLDTVAHAFGISSKRGTEQDRRKAGRANVYKAREHAAYAWDARVTFPGAGHDLQDVSYMLWAFSTALESIDGVTVEIVSWGTGSLWVDLKLWFSSIWARDDAQAAIKKAGSIIDERMNADISRSKQEAEKAEELATKNEILKNELKAMESAEEAAQERALNRRMRELEIQRAEQEVRSQTLDNDRKEIENRRLTSDLLASGMLRCDAVQVDFNHLMWKLLEGDQVKNGSHLSIISDAGQRLTSDDRPKLEQDEDRLGTGLT